ncbi:unnamed protein product [Rhizoctonia solani]|uniref:Uncharacterized protein n=1 Tax=Rhizoctonia solani TaxID=456999 RepID=A0A8H3B0X3_9AGAM|nr:unnamed protein product [Rhizoctonia solani]
MLNSLTDMNPVIAPMAMREWEEAGRLLANTLDNYLKMSTFLETSHLQGNDSGKDLINGIDSSLQTLQDQHKTLDQKFHRSRVALAKAWNRFASPIYHRPEEILSEIFLCVIYCPSNDPSCAAPLMATRQAARIQVLNIRSEYRQDIPYYRADPALGASHMHVPSIA